MNILWARRISQAFFLALFIWFSLAATLGASWWQLRGWPVDWFLQLDPLLALASLLATGTLFAGLAWALATVVLTLILGRFFCGWVCPLGTLNHLIGWLGLRGKKAPRRARLNRYSTTQNIKYYLLVFLLSVAAGDAAGRIMQSPGAGQTWAWLLAMAGLLALTLLTAWQVGARSPKALLILGLALTAWLALGRWLAPAGALSASLQSGLLDPIALIHRSFNLAVLPLAQPSGYGFSASPRFFVGGWLIATVFAAVLGLNLLRPRFYCRYVCPLGALFGVLGRLTLFRLGKSVEPCKDCRLCQAACSGAASPADALQSSECVLCLNCREVCPDAVVGYATAPSAAGEAGPDLSRRGLMLSLLSGAVFIPGLRLGGLGLKPSAPLRPPGSLAEDDLLARCTKCGQCMRVCPTGVIQPALSEAGLEGLWTPVLNFRLGTGGCLVNCVACGHLCPTAAIRPLSLDQRQGKGEFAAQGPIRLGTAFVDRGRCLPWAMDRPCIVCQEMCPVSPKAIFTRTEYQTIRGGAVRLAGVESERVRLAQASLAPGGLASGDYILRLPKDGSRRLITANREDSLTLATGGNDPLEPGAQAEIQVRLMKPYIDPKACVGCGACEHACPVSALPAIRVSPENNTRQGGGRLLAG